MTLSVVIVTGARQGYAIRDYVARALDDFERQHFRIDHLVVGSRRYDRELNRPSVDLAAFTWAEQHERIATVVPARWKTGYAGRAEGPARNERMAALFVVRAVLAFAGGAGTANMVDVALQRGLALYDCVADGERIDWMKRGGPC